MFSAAGIYVTVQVAIHKEIASYSFLGSDVMSFGGQVICVEECVVCLPYR